jgi:hypothetical protein
MTTHNLNLEKAFWLKSTLAETNSEISLIYKVDFYGGGTGKKAQKSKNTDEKPEVDKSVKDKMNARRGPGDSTKADSGGGDADRRVTSRDVDTGPINTDRGA